MSVNSFATTSRYAGIDTATLGDAPEPMIVYLRRRLVPQPERFAMLQVHIVAQGERLDNITARYLDDPEQFWRLCDANRRAAARGIDRHGRPQTSHHPARRHTGDGQRLTAST